MIEVSVHWRCADANIPKLKGEKERINCMVSPTPLINLPGRKNDIDTL
jgi:hypothetical protein